MRILEGYRELQIQKKLTKKLIADYWEAKKNHEDWEERMAKQIVIDARKERMEELDKNIISK